MKKPVIILVRTQLEENLGFVARVIANLGFFELRLVDPFCNKLDSRALCTATARGEEIIRSALIYPNVENAIGDIDFLIAFSARNRSVLKPSLESYHIFDFVKKAKKSAFMYGPEKSGLTNEDLLYADVITTIPVSNKCPSINLSHSVAITCYEFNRGLSFDEHEKKKYLDDNLNYCSPNVTKDDLRWMLNYMISKLEERGFFRKEEKKASMKQKIKAIFTRASLNACEVNIMNGILKCLSGEFDKNIIK